MTELETYLSIVIFSAIYFGSHSPQGFYVETTSSFSTSNFNSLHQDAEDYNFFLKSSIYQKFNIKNIKFQYTIPITTRFKKNIKQLCLKWKA